MIRRKQLDKRLRRPLQVKAEKCVEMVYRMSGRVLIVFCLYL